MEQENRDGCISVLQIAVIKSWRPPEEATAKATVHCASCKLDLILDGLVKHPANEAVIIKRV